LNKHARAKFIEAIKPARRQMETRVGKELFAAVMKQAGPGTQ
jgi:hypothetical protein